MLPTLLKMRLLALMLPVSLENFLGKRLRFTTSVGVSQRSFFEN